MKNLFLVILILLGSKSFAQTQEPPINEPRMMHSVGVKLLTNPLDRYEDSLVYYADSMYYSVMPENRIGANIEFIRMLKITLKIPGSNTFAFEKLKNKINIVEPEDKTFRIFNWEILRNGNQLRYYGAIQTVFDNELKTFGLVDYSEQLVRGIEDSILDNTRWFGAKYYNIIQQEVNGGRAYFLLGFNSSDVNSNKKIVECMYFNSKQEVVFGAPVFQSNYTDKICNRFLLEYQKDSKASLNWDTQYNTIIFDHLESNVGDPAKKYTNVPDGTYDGLKWNGTIWRLKRNVVQITEINQNQLLEGVNK